MSEFIHQRHKPPSEVLKPRELILACAPMRSNVNLSRIVRAAACCGVQKMVVCGNPKIDPKIARDGINEIEIITKRSLPPVLKDFQQQGYHLVGLEQTTNSQNIHTYSFPEQTVLVIGNERKGITEEVLGMLDAVVEIPVYGRPFSYNAATATCMALYEYCKQFPD